MKAILYKAALLLLPAALAVPAAQAEEASLKGSWSGAYVAHIYHPDSVTSGGVRMNLVIEDQDGGSVAGYHEWFLDADNDGKPDVEAEIVREAREDLVGVIDFDGRTIRLIETRDNGVFQGHLTAAGTLQLIYTENSHGEATVFRVTLTRDDPVGFTRVRTAEDFAAAFCDADRSRARVFMAPLAAFVDGEVIECRHGASMVRMVEPAEDPGHVVLNIDPPAEAEDGFDCDGKADIGIRSVALNCLPANAEAADHRKP